MLNKDKHNQYNHELEGYKSLVYNQSAKENFALSQPATAETEQQRARNWADFNRKKDALNMSISSIANELLHSLRVIITEIENVQNTVMLKRLGRWQRDQALHGNGAPLLINALDEIQVWFEKLAELIWTTRNSIDAIRKLNAIFDVPMDSMNEHIDLFYTKITQLLQQLIVSGFIVEKQPPQVMKTNTRFAATVRLLMSNVGIQMNNPSVTVSILSGNYFLFSRDYDLIIISGILLM